MKLWIYLFMMFAVIGLATAITEVFESYPTPNSAGSLGTSHEGYVYDINAEHTLWNISKESGVTADMGYLINDSGNIMASGTFVDNQVVFNYSFTASDVGLRYYLLIGSNVSWDGYYGTGDPQRNNSLFSTYTNYCYVSLENLGTVTPTIYSGTEYHMINGITAYNLSETPPCVEEWTANFTECVMDNQTKYYYDNNSCGTYDDLPLDNGTIVFCGCIENWISNNSECVDGSYNITYYDANNCGTFDDLPIDDGDTASCGSASVEDTVSQVNNTLISIFVVALLIAILMGLAFVSIPSLRENNIAMIVLGTGLVICAIIMLITSLKMLSLI